MSEGSAGVDLLNPILKQGEDTVLLFSGGYKTVFLYLQTWSGSISLSK